MSRHNVWLPDALSETVKDRLPDVNLSAVLQRALAGLLECRHEHLSCARCATPVDGRQLELAALDRFYSDLLWRLGELTARGGTAEGAARVAKDVGERHQIPLAARLPLPRPSRAERRAAKVRPLPCEAEALASSKANHPTNARRRTA